MMKSIALFKSIFKFIIWSLASLSVGLAVVVAFFPGNASLAKYVLEPITYNIAVQSYGSIPLVSLGACSGIEKVGQTLTGGALTPSGAAATYKWQRSLNSDDGYMDIEGATSSTYTLLAGDFNYYIRLVATGTGIYTGTVTSPHKGPVDAKTVSIAAVEGVSYPINGNIAATTLPDTSEYTAAISWSPTPTGGIFQANTVYTAIITISPKSGYTLDGVPANFFTVAGAESVSNSADSGVVTAIFQSTALTPVTDITAITGIPRVGQTLTAGTITPLGATVTYQWQRSLTSDGSYTNVSGATSNSYTLTAGDFNYYFRVTATGTGSYSGAATSSPAGPVLAKPISIAAVAGVGFPVTDQTGSTTVTATSEYTGTVSWSPALVSGKFMGNTVYTATITLTPKSGYTVSGVTANFFTVSGASSVTNSADSGVITAVFPSTTLTQLTAIEGIIGVSRVGNTLTVGALTPSAATANYQWQRSMEANGSYTDINGATSGTYIPVAGDYNYFIRVVASGTGNYSGIVNSPYKGPVTPAVVSIAAIPGVATPITGNTAVTSITATSQYTGTVSWSPALNAGKFEGNTVYTATITLTPKSGFTMTGVSENFFTLAGASPVTNAINSGVVTAVFPSTALIPLTSIGPISGTAQVDQLLTAGALTPAEATVTYQWQSSNMEDGTYTDILGATSSTYTVKASDYNYYLKVTAIANGVYSGAVQSSPLGPIQMKPVSIAALGGLSAPVNAQTAPVSITETSQYTGTVSWSPALVEGKFQGGVVYTASINISPKTGYTLNGVSANFFTVSGASSVTNSADSGAVTAVFPATAITPITAIAPTNGFAQVGQTLTAGSLTPSEATASYIWQRSLTADGTYLDISGATASAYTLLAGDFNYFIRVKATGTGSYSETVTSYHRGPITARTISIKELTGSNLFPIAGNAGANSINANAEYTGTVSWSPSLVDGLFAGNTEYTATVNIAAKSGYTINGLAADFFTVSGATSVTNSTNSGVVTVVFPSTSKTPLASIAGIVGPVQVGRILNTGALTPESATADYQWQRSTAAAGPYTNISGATSSSYTLTTSDINYFIRVMATGTGDYSGSVYSPYKGPVELSPYTIAAISGLTEPEGDATAEMSIVETSQYTGAVSWSPALVAGEFQGGTIYTATITLTPKAGYTANGVTADFFTVAGATSVGNAANSGVITVVFPSTDLIHITSIAGIIGTERSGNILMAGALSPSGATATYQWVRSSTPDGTYSDISGETSSSYLVTPGDFGYYLKVVATGSGSYSGIVTSPYKGPVEPSKINIAAISGVSYPVTGGTASAQITETAQYTGTVSWSPTPTGGIFQANTVYTATITLTPKTGYTLTGVTQNFFTVSGATSVTNSAGSGVITAVFPSTALIPVTAIAGVGGTEQVGKTLTAGAITPAGATVSYQWQRSITPDGTFTNIAGATSSNYTIVAGYYNYYIRVVATGTGGYAGSATSPYKGPIAAAPISRTVISGITPPVKDSTAVTSIGDTNEYTAVISWSPAPVGGVFAGNTVYTATVTLSPKSGYTVNGIPQNYFSVSGADSVTNPSNSGVVTVVFPSTVYTPLTAITAPSGSPKVGMTLTAGNLTPSSATVTYQWQISSSPEEGYTNISGATSSTYQLAFDDYEHYFRLIATGTGDYAGIVTSEHVGPVTEGPVTLSAISGLPYPVYGETAVSSITETSQYTGTVSWSPTPVEGVFSGNTSYTATITLSPKTRYTMTGVAENFFSVSGASSVTNSADSGIITAVFPSTALTPLSSVVGINGIEQVGQTLLAGELIPAEATATYQWKRSSTPDGLYTNISGATSDTYVLTTEDYGFYFKVEATGTGDYSGAATSPYRGPIENAPINIIEIGGVGYPVTNQTAATTVTETGQYTGTISWSPALSAGKFLTNTEYTATITLQPKSGYGVCCIPANFFTVIGASSVTNPAGSAVITAVFPSTARTPLSAIGNITGTIKVDQALTAGALSPSGATAAYQWQRSTTGLEGSFTNIYGATSTTYNTTAGDYNYYIRVIATGTGDYSAAAVSETVGPVQAATVNIAAIEGIPVPVKNQTPVTTITATSQFTGTVTWSPNPPGGKFKQNTAYTATITLAPKSGYTLNGVTANFFTVFGAQTQSNSVNSGVITATYPKTRYEDITAIGGISGIPQVGQTLTAGAVEPAGATVTYQWFSCSTPEGIYDPVSGATGTTYLLTAADYDKYFKVEATGSVDYGGAAMSPYKGPIQPAIISISAISGVTPPVTGATAAASLPGTAQYTASISWSPSPTGGIFQEQIIYTATITITPKSGYTLSGVGEDFFTVAGSSFISNAAGSGVVTAEFPETE